MATNRENIYIPLEDVESEHCALIVEKGLAQVKGVETHKVELNNRRAAITVDSNETVGEAVKAIKDLGYGVPTVKSAFPVLGMTCASCAGSAESIVKYQPGVVNASVNFATGNLTVEYLPNMTDASTLQKAVQGVGYDLLIEDETKQQETLEAIHEKKFRTLKNKTIWAIILSLPVVIIGMFFMDMPYADPIMWLFSTPVVIWLGRDFFFNTGTGSPLNMLSSTYELPDMTMPSTAIFSPGFTSITSPALTSSIAVCFSVPSACTTMTVFGCKPISFLMAEEVLPLALSSSSFPKRMNAIITAAASKYT